jgi:hypothetical protein
VSHVLLEGGPYDGRLIAAESAVVSMVYAKPIPPVVPPDEPPSWWRHPIRWLRWRRRSPKFLLMPEPQQLTYRDTGRIHDGARVYAVDGNWVWFRGPQAVENGDLLRSLAAAYGAVHPMIRQDRQTRWVMDLAWYKRIRAMSISRVDPDYDDPDKWVPSPLDLLLGVEIAVMDDGGVPHLENRRYPADWTA